MLSHALQTYSWPRVAGIRGNHHAVWLVRITGGMRCLQFQMADDVIEVWSHAGLRQNAAAPGRSADGLHPAPFSHPRYQIITVS